MLYSSLNDKLNDHHVGPITTIFSHLFSPEIEILPKCAQQKAGERFFMLFLG